MEGSTIVSLCYILCGVWITAGSPHCYFTVSLLSDRVRCTTNYAFFIVAAVAFSALLWLLGFSINYTRVLNTSRLLKFAYCALYVCACLTYQTIVVLSAKLTKATTKVHTGCHLPIYITFLLGLFPK